MIDSFVGISILSKQEISLLLERETPSIQSLISSLVLTTIAQSEKKYALKTTLSLKSRSSNLCQSPLNNLKASILFIYRLLLSVLKPCMARPIVSFFLKANTESTKWRRKAKYSSAQPDLHSTWHSKRLLTTMEAISWNLSWQFKANSWLGSSARLLWPSTHMSTLYPCLLYQWRKEQEW